MSLMPFEEPRYLEMNEVVRLFAQNINPSAIAKQLGIRRVDVLDHLDEWRKSRVMSEFAKDRVDDLIMSMDEHYSLLIRKAYEIIDEVDDLKKSDKETMTRSQMLSQKKGALDLIAKLEKDRIDIFQKTGLLEMDSLGDELAKMESEKQLILNILKNDLCNHCKPVVMSKIASMLGGEPVDIVPGEVQ